MMLKIATTLALNVGLGLLLLLAAPDRDGGGVGEGRAPVTYAKDVAPIFFKHCASCHRPGEIAPMSLMSYREARPWAKSIREQVIGRQMPPWHADPAYGHFKNDRRLSPPEIETIVAWVDGGAQEGHSKDLPPAPAFTAGWQIGQPDAVFAMSEEYQVPAEGVVQYQYFVVPTDFAEDRWVQAAEIRPGNRAVVHHVIAYLAGPEVKLGRPGLDGRLESLTGTAPGEMPLVLPEGFGKRVRAGSRIVFQVHYTPNGRPQRDRASIGLVFNKRPVRKVFGGGAAINPFFLIPPGADNHEVRASYAFREDVHIWTLMPHMHLRGKDFRYRLVYPDGTSQILLSVPRYDFNWQTRYELAEPIAAPRGSRLECIAHFDNSAGNKFNPDPTRRVLWGQQTWEEMMIGFVGFTRDAQDLRAPVPGR